MLLKSDTIADSGTLPLTICPSDPEHIVIFYEHLLRLISDDWDDDVNRKLVNFKILPEYPFCAPERPPTCFNGLCIYESVHDLLFTIFFRDLEDATHEVFS